jgi:chemotaxis protein MotB
MAAGGGAWKVAYADFVTAMMAFFMVMWLTGQNDGVKEAVAGYFREPFATYKSHQKGAAATAKPVLDPMYGHTAQPQKRRLAISGDVTDYQFTILFPEGLAELEPEQLAIVRDFAPMMAGKLNRIEVRAHCIRSPLPPNSPFRDHWDMCFTRCQRVRGELESLGIEPERIRLSQAEGNEPLATNLTPEELKLNSRVDVILLPDLADIPWERRRAEEEEPASTTTMEPLAADGSTGVESHEAPVVPADDGHEAHPAIDSQATAEEHGSQESDASHDDADSHGKPPAHAEPELHGDASSHGEPTVDHAVSGEHDDHGAEHPPAEVHVPPPH